MEGPGARMFLGKDKHGGQTTTAEQRCELYMIAYCLAVGHHLEDRK